MAVSMGKEYATAVTLAAIDKPNPSTANPAIALCCKAWKKAYRASIDDGDYEQWASGKAGEAYRAALPPLTTRENCRDFIACVAYGMSIGAIPERNAGKLLYAAQVVLSSFVNEPKVRECGGEASRGG